MLVFWEQRLVFLATPKAGSTAVETFLEPLASFSIQRPPEMKHLSAADYTQSVAPLLKSRAGEEFTTVALMREPISWLQSWYRFRLRDDHDDPDHPMNGESFEEFVTDYLSDTPPTHARVGRQSDYVTDGAGQILVDQLFRYEDMDDFVHFLEERLDCEVTLPRINVPPAVDVGLSEGAYQALSDKLAADFELYHRIARSPAEQCG